MISALFMIDSFENPRNIVALPTTMAATIHVPRSRVVPRDIIMTSLMRNKGRWLYYKDVNKNKVVCLTIFKSLWLEKLFLI